MCCQRGYVIKPLALQTLLSEDDLTWLVKTEDAAPSVPTVQTADNTSLSQPPFLCSSHAATSDLLQGVMTEDAALLSPTSHHITHSNRISSHFTHSVHWASSE